jgi:hypothetical protein
MIKTARAGKFIKATQEKLMSKVLDVSGGMDEAIKLYVDKKDK